MGTMMAAYQANGMETVVSQMEEGVNTRQQREILELKVKISL